MLLLAMTACDEIEGVDYLTRGHPADPAAPAGKRPAISRALVPENINVQPELQKYGRSGPSRPTSSMAMPAMDHSGKRGSHP